MAAQGGLDSLELLELDQSGNVGDSYGVPMRGCHTGRSAALNVPNPQPGVEYYWADRNDVGTLTLFENGGWRPVRQGDPEYRENPYGRVDPRGGSPLDTAFGHRELILLRIDEADYAVWKQAEADAARRQMEAAGSGFEGTSRPEEAKYSEPGRPIRYVRSKDGFSDELSGRGLWETD